MGIWNQAFPNAHLSSFNRHYNQAMRYRRSFLPGGTFFFTLVTYQRRPIFSSPEPIDILRNVFRGAMRLMPFIVVASVILPDHLHFIWTLPPDSSDYSTRWRWIKGRFTRSWWATETHTNNASRLQKGEKEVWQRRFWEHLIRDERDLTRHIEYIHFNPVKHGLVDAPRDWTYSSFLKYVNEELYPLDWGMKEEIWEGETMME